MPTIKQKKAFKEVLKGSTITGAMKKAGYSESTTTTTGKLTNTDGWKELMNKYLPDDKLADHHNQLLNQKRLDYFVFPKNMEDEEIEISVKEAGLKVVNIRMSDKGKMAFYSTDDAMAKKSALDMAYKLKGSYAAEKQQNVNVNVEVTATSKELEDLRMKYEEELLNKYKS